MVDSDQPSPGAASDPEVTEAPRSAEGERIKGRYLVLQTLGRGGMAVVHRVTDMATRSDVALKRLAVAKDDPRYAASAELFEREFHTLAQLSHPRIVEVYDYGVDEHGPFYTMEMLDGGDVRERCPMDWKEACSLAYDVCSALALLHSRRLVHRDVSPRNVRSTRDGKAKLIDFGAMVPMGPGGAPVGTPQFVAPEVVYRAHLDARTDLFSLGVTLYFALTGRAAYPAKDFTEAVVMWRDKPLPPSRYVRGIPEALDALVLSLIGAEPATRPRTAFEVMQRLAVVAGLGRVEPSSVSRAYLSTPVMVGREESMKRIEHDLGRALGGRGRSILIEGPAGVGRSRVLDASALLAKTFGATVLRASGNASAARSFGVAGALAEQLLDNSAESALSRARDADVRGALFDDEAGAPASDGSAAEARPRLRDLGGPDANRFHIQTALSRWFMNVSRDIPLVIAVDDFHRIDEPSAALLGALASQIDGRRLLVIASAESGADPGDRLALDVLARRSTRIVLTPLAPADVERLFESVFGDVPNVGILSNRIHAIALGNPRESMDLAQHLVDKGVVHYEGGNWTLPDRLDDVDLPGSAEDAMRARIASLGPLARWLAETQALATQRTFTRDDYARVRPDAQMNEIDAAILDLVAHQIVATGGGVYALSHRGWNAALIRSLGKTELEERHRALASLYEGRLTLGVVRHALLAGLETKALDALSPILPGLPEGANLHEGTDLGATDVAAVFEHALTAAERIARPPREVNDLRRWLASLSVVSDDRYYWRAAPAWLARLKLDSGYTIFEELREVSEPAERLSKAMQRAFERYAATPEAERAYRPDEAVKGLAHYVGISIAIGTSRLELELIESLQPLLEPFAPLSPLVATLCQNVAATRESSCRSRPERARELWRDVYERLRELQGAEEQFVGVFRRAVAYAIGTAEASMGIAAAADWADRLDDDPAQRVNGLYLRRIVRLQQGDWDGAEKLRRQAEVLSLQTRARQMFTSLNAVELTACAMARDMTGLQQCGDRIAALAARSPGWIPHRHVAKGHFHLACDDFHAALGEFEKALAISTPRPEKPHPLALVWSMSVAGYVEALTGLDRREEARAAGENALATCRELDVGFASHGIARAVAIAEAKLGDVKTARMRLDAVIEQQVGLGITGLHLGASYEARARVALLSADAGALERFTALTAREYRHGQGSPLGARYERLMDEASRTVKRPLARLSDFEATAQPTLGEQASTFAFVSSVMKGAVGPDERAERALTVLCDRRAAPVGHLFLAADGRLRLAASHGAHAPPEGLEEFVQNYFDRETGESDGATAAVSEDEAASALAAAQFTDPRGQTFYPLLLTGPSGTDASCAGVAALALGAHHRMVDQELVVALAMHILKATVTR